MSEYHKINTVFKRDIENKSKALLEGQYSNEYFEYLALMDWVWTEKVDGTNIRIIVDPIANGGRISFGGRTANAQIPASLINRLEELFFHQSAKLNEDFPNGAVLYGEGYGAKIQKVGALYRPDQDFVLFDVKVGNWWLKRPDLENVASTFGLSVVPIVGRGNLLEMVEFVKVGFNSTWTHGGAFRAEGVVARPVVELKTRSGNRIITKLKCSDFAEKEKPNGSHFHRPGEANQEMENNFISPAGLIGL